VTEFPGGWTTNAVGGENGVPALLLHGTQPELVDAILSQGLVPNGIGVEVEAVYLTESLNQAGANSYKRDERLPRFIDAGVLIVDVTGLPLLRLGFYTCPVSIVGDRITRLAEHPARWRIRRRGDIGLRRLGD
jgi:hypothetical protein